MIEYIINKEKKTVVAKFNCKGHNDRGAWMYYIMNHVWKLIDKYSFDYSLKHYVLEKELDKLDGRFYGIAHCSDKDTFDINFGKELAKKRLLKKYYKVQMNYENKLCHIVNNIAADIAAAVNTDRLKLVKFTDEIDNMSL